MVALKSGGRSALLCGFTRQKSRQCEPAPPNNLAKEPLQTRRLPFTKYNYKNRTVVACFTQRAKATRQLQQNHTVTTEIATDFSFIPT